VTTAFGARIRDRIVGVDGCKAGWVVVWLDAGAVQAEVVPTDAIGEVVQHARWAGVDMPIGLSDDRDRAADAAARRLLKGRASSIFSAPLRTTLDAPDYASAKARQRSAHVDGKALSIQAFALVPKIAALDAALRASPMRAARVIEVHPELGFARGMQRLPSPKKSPDGRDERGAWLTETTGWRGIANARRLRGGVAEDDVLDALAVLHVLTRFAAGTATAVVSPAPRDRFSLPMTIWYADPESP
jgi:predicted RNase H-like nuclease